LIKTLVFLLLVADVFPYPCLISTHGRYQVAARPEALASIILLSLSLHSCQMDCTLALMNQTTCEIACLRGIEIIIVCSKTHSDEWVGDLPPLLILHGDQDTNIPVSNALELAPLCSKAELKCDVHIYPKEGHGSTPEILHDADQ
jgi:acetyl esterase/lipase